MHNNIRDSFALFCYEEELEADIIYVICKYCFHSTPFNLNGKTNRCKHCSIIIQEEDHVFTAE